MKHQVLGALRPTVGNTVRLTDQFSGRYPIELTQGAHSWLAVREHRSAFPPRTR